MGSAATSATGSTTASTGASATGATSIAGFSTAGAAISAAISGSGNSASASLKARGSKFASRVQRVAHQKATPALAAVAKASQNGEAKPRRTTMAFWALSRAASRSGKSAVKAMESLLNAAMQHPYADALAVATNGRVIS